MNEKQAQTKTANRQAESANETTGEIKMRNAKKIATLSTLAAICFFIVYFIKNETTYLAFGCVWIVIAIEECIRIKKRDDK